jgi:hypothetical protein
MATTYWTRAGPPMKAAFNSRAPFRRLQPGVKWPSACPPS